MLRVYTSKDCVPCVILKKILKEEGIEFEEVDVDEKNIKVKELPVIEKDGRIVMVGLPLSKKDLLKAIQ
jgi:glutaredoxin